MVKADLVNSPVERVRRRVDAFLDREKRKPMAARKTQTDLARHLGIGKSSVHGFLNAESAHRGALARLDILAAYCETTPAELVKAWDSRLSELSKIEEQVLRFWRSWPQVIQARVFALLSFFGAVTSDEPDLRVLVMGLRYVRQEDYWRIQQAIDACVADSRRKGPPTTEEPHDAPTHKSDTLPRAPVHRKTENGG